MLNRFARFLTFLSILCFGFAVYTFYANNSSSLQVDMPTIASIKDIGSIQYTAKESGLVAISKKEIINPSKLNYIHFSADYLSVMQDGKQIPHHIIEHNEDEYLLFYADVDPTHVTQQSHYLIGVGQGNPMRTSNASSNKNEGETTAETTFHWEKNEIYVPEASGRNPWFANTPSEEITISLDDITPIKGSEGVLKLQLWVNKKSPLSEQLIQIKMNDKELLETKWTRDQLFSIELPIPEGILRSQEEGNQITIQLDTEPSTSKTDFYIDTIDLTYQTELIQNKKQQFIQSDAPDLQIQSVLNSADEPVIVVNVTDPADPVFLTHFTSTITTNADAEIIQKQSILSTNHDSDTDYAILSLTDAIDTTTTFIEQQSESLRDPNNAYDYLMIYPDNPDFLVALDPLIDYHESKGLQVKAISLPHLYEEFGSGGNSPETIRTFIQYTMDSWTASPSYLLLVGDDQLVPNQETNVPTYIQLHKQYGRIATDYWYAYSAEDELYPLAVGRFPANNAEEVAQIVLKTREFYSQTNLTTNMIAVRDIQSTSSESYTAMQADSNAKIYQIANWSTPFLEALNQSSTQLLLVSGTGDATKWGKYQYFSESKINNLENEHPPILLSEINQSGLFMGENETLPELLLQTYPRGIVAAVAPTNLLKSDEQIPLPPKILADIQARWPIGRSLLTHIKKQSDTDEPFPFVLLGDPALKIQKGDPDLKENE